MTIKSTTIARANSGRRAFATRRYPTFGRGIYNDDNPPATVVHSPFYWWFRFLQLNDEYAKALTGKPSKVASQLVTDFGDVRHTDFKSWWNAHVDLFAEPVSDYKMIVATSADQLAAFGDDKAINIVVPLTWTNVGIKRRFAQIIDQLVDKTQKGVRAHVASQAKYKLGRKWSTAGFQHAYDVYVNKLLADAETEVTGKKVAWADIAIRAKLPAAAGLREREVNTKTMEQRRTLTILALRHYKQAQAFIAASASNTFPPKK